MSKVRIQKWLSELGVLSRRQAEAYIQEKRIKVNGELVTPGLKVDPETDNITIDGKAQKKLAPAKIYWLLNKPDFTLVSHVPQDNMKTIYELPALKKLPFRLNTVGRLDYRTEGLLLLSNDGELINELSHPKNAVPRVYHVLTNKALTKDEISEINKQGVTLKDGLVRCQILKVQKQKLGTTSGVWYQVTVREGRNRLVRRLFEKLDRKVVRLMRVCYGNVVLPQDLKPGVCRALTSDEIRALKKCVK